MINFKLDVEVEDNVLYISNENGSGAEYEVSSFDKVLHYIKYYINNYIKNNSNDVKNPEDGIESIAPFCVYDHYKSKSPYGGVDIFAGCLISKYEEKFIDSYKPHYYTYYFSTEEKCNEFYNKIKELYDTYKDTKLVEQELEKWRKSKDNQ